MKKSGLLHAQLSRIIASLGHADWLVIGDCGLSIPAHVERIDLAVTRGLPRFEPTVVAIAQELVVQRVFIAEEMELHNAEIFAFTKLQFSDMPIETVSNVVFKERISQAKAVVRTGEATPYANVILECGVSFK